MKKLLLAPLFLMLFALNGAEAAVEDKCIPAQPSPPRLVNNLSKEFPEFLSAEEEHTLEKKLQNFSNETSNQIVIVIVDDLCGYEANDFCTRLGELWGVGQGKFDNGIVIMIKPTGSAGGRDAYIAIGYGLEGIIPDLAGKRIVEKEVVPFLKIGENYNALNNATDVLMSLAKKEFAYADYNRKNKIIVDRSAYFGLGMMLLILVLVFIFRKRRGYTIGRGGRTYYGRGWSNWGGGGFGGGFGGGSSGGGGFGGFGGGGFGGGGAGGKW